MNIVAGPKGRGEAVLIRALNPTLGIELMKLHRKTDDITRLTNGPGTLVQALAVPSNYSGQLIFDTKLELIPPTQTIESIHTSPRIGIKKAVDKPWRYFI